MHKLTIVITGAVVSLLFMPAAHAAVFAEVASASYCPDCPPADRLLFDLYTSHEYPFYYVTMVGDQNEVAHERLTHDYNFYWYPTAFFDGGLDVALEASRDAYVDAIEANMNREKPDMLIDITAEWVCSECSTGVLVTVHIRNNEETPYHGTLRVYVTEVNSRWEDYDAEQYHFALLDFALVDTVTLQGSETTTLQASWIPADIYPDIDEEDLNNLAFFAVLFNATATVNYANPPDANPFNAYAVDAVAASIPENSPPSISILSPKEGYLYLFDREIGRFPKTVILGRKTVEIAAFDESGVERVEVYVDGELRATLHDTYTWTWSDVGSHTLRVRGYDTYGLNATDSTTAFIVA